MPPGTPRVFDEPTWWPRFVPGSWSLHGGWRGSNEAGAPIISVDDPYWGRVLDKARAAYGDPNLRFDTDDVLADRRLVFSDGVALPADGTLVYHDAATGRTFAQNTDGSVSPWTPGAPPGPPIPVAGFRRTADGHYAPIDAAGQQISPLVDAPYPREGGYRERDGVLIPADDAGGDASGEQQGAGPAAVRRLQEELRRQYSRVGAAEEQLAEAILDAHAGTVEGRERLAAIQHDLEAAVDNPANAIDTPAGRQAFLRFLRSQIDRITAVVATGTLGAESSAAITEAIAALYEAEAADTAPGPDPAAAHPDPGVQSYPAEAPPAASAPADPAAEPGAEGPGRAAAGDPAGDALGPAPAMPDPTLGDLLNTPIPVAAAAPGIADPNAALLSALLPGMLGGLGGGGVGGAGLGGDPLGISGWGSALAPLAGLASAAGAPPDAPIAASRDTPAEPADTPADTAVPDPPTPTEPPEPSETATAATDSGTAAPGPPESTVAPTSPTATAPPLAAEAPLPTDSAPAGNPAPATASAPGSTAGGTTVALPDGSTVTAKTPALAAAVNAYQSGTPVEAAYRANGMQLPPPGTPVLAPLDPSQITAGALGVFSDHYVVAAGPGSAFADGAVVPLSSVASSPDFLGWIDPSAASAPLVSAAK